MRYDLETLRGDVFGGITAAVVGLPVGMALGELSGLGALAGLYGAIAVGFFAAVFGGTQSQISGPTGPMAVAMAVIVVSYADSLAEAFTIAVMAGLIQILLGMIGIGRFIAYTPYSVISGCMSGVGITMIMWQIPSFLGTPSVASGPAGVVGIWTDGVGDINVSSFALAAVTLAVCVLWPGRFHRILPSPLVALIAGTLMGVLWLSNAPIIGVVPTGLPQLRSPTISFDVLVNAMQPALTLALLGSINTLLTSLRADSMTRSRHKPNQELVGQGIGNMVAGIIGGLPGAGNTMSTVQNLRVGGRTQVSGALCAAILLALVLGLGRYVEAIPHAVLAGILMKVGWDIIDWRFFKLIHRVQREHLVVMVVTLGLTVLLDLVTAVAMGLIVAGMVAARRIEKLELDSVISVPLLDRSFLSDQGAADEVDPFSARVGLVALRGTFTVASSNKLVATISRDIQDHEVVILDFSETVHIDDSAALVVDQMIDVAISENTGCVVVGLAGEPADTLHGLDVLRHVPPDHFVTTMDEARDLAQEILDPLS